MSFAFARTPEEIDAMTEEAIERANAIVSGLVILSPDLGGDAAAPRRGRGGARRVVRAARVHGVRPPRPSGAGGGRGAEERLQKWAVDLVFQEDLYRAVKGVRRDRGSKGAQR